MMQKKKSIEMKSFGLVEESEDINVLEFINES